MIPILLLIINISSTVVKDIQFNEHELSINRGKQFTIVRLRGLEITREVGAPELPVKSIRIALPKGAVFKDITILSTKSRELPGEYLISCTQPPVILSQKQAKKSVEPNPEIYSSYKLYPEKIIEYKGKGIYDNQQICEFLFYPVQYLPYSKKLIFHSQVRFAVSYEGGMKIPATSEFTKKIVVNPEDITVNPKRIQRDDFKYLIITNPPMDTVFQRLADWKTKKGIKAEVRTVNWILTNYPGEDNAAKIRNYVKTLPDSNTEYVLLAGDTDVIPCRLAFAMSCEYGGHPREDSLPCDLYYADLQGDWDLDNNGVYGEIADSIDLYPDIFIGRAPVNTIAEAQKFVEKILTYEKNPAFDYLDNAMFAADVLWSNPYTDQGIHKNKIEEESFPPNFEITKLYYSQGTLSKTSVLNALNQGQGLSNHDGHGWYNLIGVGTGYIYSSDFDNLTNAPKFGIFFSLGCWTSAFDLDAIAEHFVNSPNGGGVAYIGNSSYGWGSPGNPGFGYSDIFDSRFFYSLLQEDNFHLGAALSLSKVYFIPHSREKNVYRWHQYQLNLLGDPEMPVWTAIPESLTVFCPQTIPLGNSRILITVKDKETGTPLENALVCLMKGTESYASGYTDVGGSIYLDATPSSTGDFDLTVTAHNYIPDEKTVPVISGCYVNYCGWILNDASGNNDNAANPNENILLTTTIKNCGNATSNSIQMKLRSSDPLVIIQDSTESYASLAHGDSIIINDAFEITIGAAPDGHGIGFDLEITDASQTLNFSPVITVGTPLLGIDEILIYSAPTMPNEDESLYVVLENLGHGFGHSTYAKLISNDSYVAIVTDSVWFSKIYPETLKLAAQPFVVSINPSCPSSYLVKLPVTIHTNDYNFNDTINLLIGETGFSDDMESGDGLWTTGGTLNHWHLSTRRSVSPNHSWYCGEEISGQYVHNMNCYIQTVPFMINANSFLSFYRWFQVPLYGSDGIYVIIMGDGFSDTLDFMGTGGALEGRDIQSNWFEEVYSLSHYPAGETIQVRIAFISDGGQGVGEGFHIDDLNIKVVTAIEETTQEGIATFFSIYPNPFKQTTNIRYQITEHQRQEVRGNKQDISLKIYDITGRLVNSFLINSFDHDGLRTEGQLTNSPINQVTWQGDDNLGRRLPAGVYFVRLVVDSDLNLTKKVILLR